MSSDKTTPTATGNRARVMWARARKMTMESEELKDLLSINGILSQKLKGFESRPSQVEMLDAVLSAYQEDRITLIEAGTGTGKSLAYLLPALFWALEKGEPTLISTNTIALQEQLVKKDIPFLLEALGLKVKATLVKGMNNYLCKRKLADSLLEKNFFSAAELEEIEKIEAWEGDSPTGCKSDLGFTPLHETWERVNAEGESCTHAKCPHYKECFFFKARKEAEDSQLLIANHHLLFADLSIRMETANFDASCILPPYRRVILDEAHHVEEVATEHFAKKVSRFSLFRLLNRLLSEKSGGKLKALHHKLCDLYPEIRRDQNISKLFSALELDFPHEKRKVMDLVDSLFKASLDFCAQFAGAQEKMRIRAEERAHPFWLHIQEKARELTDEGRRFLAAITSIVTTISGINDLHTKCEGILADIGGILSRIDHSFETILEFVFSPENDESVKWIEISAKQNIHFVMAKLDVASLLKESLFDEMESVVLCSATLATKKEFKFVKETLGIVHAKEHLYDSPFNFQEQCRLMVPLDLPHPDDKMFTKEASEAILKAIHAAGGGVFVLFTSYAMLMGARHLLRERLQAEGYTLLCQGEENTHTLLTRFRNRERAVLFGTDSFWEGVDVVGDALRMVIIVKLPFLVPTDPLFQGKSEKMRKEGKSPFADYSLPHAVMKFKQGFGRLIRSQTDRGCVVCLDGRIATKGYGKLFLGSLPPCPHHCAPLKEILEDLELFYSSHFVDLSHSK